jgi:putative DNA primase/helicase
MREFIDAIRATGLEPPEHMEPDKLYRFPGLNKKRSKPSGWCKLFSDGLGGVYGDFTTNLSATWQAKREKPYTAAEKAQWHHQLKEAQAQQRELEKAEKARQRKKALKTWQSASPVENHPYLTTKGIKSHGLRSHVNEHGHSNLLIPVIDTHGLFQGYQWIGGGGAKGFSKGCQKKGCYFLLGEPVDGELFYISEGYATAATTHESKGQAVAAAFDADNLLHAALAIHQQYPRSPIVMAADNDIHLAENKGILKAQEAAEAVGGTVIYPIFTEEAIARFRAEHGHDKAPTDFNDLYQLEGLAEVKKQLDNVTPIHGGKISTTFDWPEPMPLVTQMAELPYPLDALPEKIRMAVEEVQAFVKAPIPLVATSALSAISLAIQAHVDIRRAHKLSGPTGLFTLSIAESGERKSTCDGFFTAAIKHYEREQAELAKPLLSEHRAALGTWEAKRKGIKEKIQQLAKSEQDSSQQVRVLQDLECNKPEEPRIPKLMYEDSTPEALKWALAKHWPSAGVMSSEAGLVLGAHGMSKDSVMRSLATFNKLWDGGETQTDRRTSECFDVRGARLTVALQIQESALCNFFEQSGSLARGTGFMARFLIAWPKSTQGTRPFSEPPKHWPALEAFNTRMLEILNSRVPIEENGQLKPTMLDLSLEAKSYWIAFHDDIECQLAPGEGLSEVRDVASKIADNAARLAALFQVFEHGLDNTVSEEAMVAASRIALWHLRESQRFFGELALPEELMYAAKLEEWLIGYCRTHEVGAVPTREAKQFAPYALRKKAAFEAAAKELVDLGRVRITKSEGKKSLAINPKLL